MKKLLALNDADTSVARVEMILLSRNSADTRLRVFNSIRHHGISITRATFTRGESTYRIDPRNRANAGEHISPLARSWYLRR
jgi:5'-nucleotidase